MEKLIEAALACGFTHAAPLAVDTLKPMTMVRDACAADKCQAYGKNWTCPPTCGTLEECDARMRQYSRGILLQTVGQLAKRIDTKGYMRIEAEHREHILAFAERMRQEYPDILCLGAGGCRVCQTCAYPEPCRFPEKSMSSMEAYGLFVTQVCRDNGMGYYYGPKTLAYTACILF